MKRQWLILISTAFFVFAGISHAVSNKLDEKEALEKFLPNLGRSNPTETLDEALQRHGFTILGKTIYFNSFYPNWLVKLEFAAERFKNANVINRIINDYSLKTPFVPEKILLKAKNFDSQPILLTEKIWMQQCKEDILTFYQSLSPRKQAEIAFVILKSGIADIDSYENLPKTTRMRAAFIDTAHTQDNYRARLHSYNNFVRKLMATKGQFYTINDNNIEDEEIGKLINGLTSPNNLFTKWAGSESVTFVEAEETFLKDKEIMY